jgi:hypothetical protein
MVPSTLEESDHSGNVATGKPAPLVVIALLSGLRGFAMRRLEKQL